MNNEALVKLIRCGGNVKEYQEELYYSNWGIMWQQLKKYEGLADKHDLEQECYLAMLEAIESYQEEKGAFVTWYTHMIAFHMARYFENTNAVHLPRHMLQKVNDYKKAVSDYEREHGGHADLKAKKKITGLSDAEIGRVETLLKGAKSLDANMDSQEGVDISLGDCLKDPNAEFEERILDECAEDALAKEVRALVRAKADELQYNIIMMRHVELLPYKDIAARLSITEEKAHRLYKKALRAMRTDRARELLRAYEGDCVYLKPYSGSLALWKNTGYSIVEKSAEILEKTR